MSNSLQARGLVKNFGALVATDHVDLDITIGEIHAVIGPNGAGKTTLLAQLSGQMQPDAGQVLLDGDDITTLTMSDRSRRGIARSFQITSIIEPFTVRANIETALHPHVGRVRRRKLRELAEPYLAEYGLLDIADVVASELAHGQKRQLDVAMALTGETRFLLLDEPLAGVGPEGRETLAGLVDDLRTDHGILLIEHDIDTTFQLADRVTVLDQGAVLATGSPDAIRNDADVRRVYLGEDDHAAG